MTDSEKFMKEVREKWDLLSRKLGMKIQILRVPLDQHFKGAVQARCECGWAGLTWDEKTERDAFCAESLNHRLTHIISYVEKNSRPGAH